MKMICSSEINNKVLQRMGVYGDVSERILIKGWDCVLEENNIFYFQQAESDKENEFIIIELSDDSIFELDKLQTGIVLNKKFVRFDNNRLIDTEDKKCFIYTKRNDDIELEECSRFERILSYNYKKQLDLCDLYLLIPGKLNKDEGAWDDIPEVNSEFFNVFKNNIDTCVSREFNSEFAKDLERKCIGSIVIEIIDITDGKTYLQDAVIGIVKHKTGFCILEIITPDCAIGGNKLLSYYCGDFIKIIYANKKYSVQEFMEKLKIRRFGKKRSIVFAYNCTDENEIINALANEENPMGVIGGDFSKKVQNENIAQYDTAQVYVSHETMFEKCKEINIIGDERLEYNAIEIFFVELILFQDAAIDKIYIDLQEEADKQRGYRDVNEATERYEQLSFDMAMAIRFGDYEQFNYPTVRASARKIAQSFGLELIYEKYRLNKELLATMIESNKRKIQERQDRIKNFFLLLLSALSIIPTLGEILQSIFAENHDEIFCYTISLAIVLVGFAIYKLIGVLDIAAAKRAADKDKK
ncbi:MAG: hypothetical protein E7505_09765 [Ruminococcus sp.]|nr:hypothetical protein [Ruminococcus sp.]